MSGNKAIHGNSRFMGDTKICSMCKVDKPKTEFSKRLDRPCGVRSKCKECEAKIRATPKMKDYYKKQGSKYYIENRESILKRTSQWSKNNHEKVLVAGRKWQSKPENKIKKNAYGREYSKRNLARDREKRSIANKAWREDNRDYSRAYMKEYKKNRVLTDSDFLAKTRITSNFRVKMIRKLNKKQNTFFNYTNTSLDDYVDYLKKENPLLWDKYSIGSNIHIDHIIPCNLYDFTNNDEIAKCWDKRNLRLLPAKENIRKKDTLFPELIIEYGIKDLLPKGVIID